MSRLFRTALGFLRSGTPVSFAVRVVLLLLALTGITLLPLFHAYVLEPLMVLDAKLTHWIVQLFGADTTQSGRFVYSDHFSIEVIPGCTGLYTMVILTAMVLAFPVSWKRRLVGAAVGIGLILTLNLTRLVTLFFVGRSYPQLFEEAHVVVWQSITIVIALVFWYSWAQRSLARLDAARAEAERPA